LTIQRYREPDAVKPRYRIRSTPPPQPALVPAAPVVGPGHWRKLTVEITPEEVRAFWAERAGASWVDHPAGTLSRAQLRQGARSLATNRLDSMPDVNPGFGPRDALGLYVYRGAASFRSVVVEPFGED
jgi:hypothetical protein